MEHAKGKWESTFRSNNERGVRNKDGFICFLPKPPRFSGQDKRYEEELEETKANAKLISQSPIMFDYIQEKANNGCKKAKEIVANVLNN